MFSRKWSPAITSLIIAIIVLFFVIMVWLQLDRPLVFDEIEWPLVAKGITRHGFPVSYFGEDAFVRRYSTELMGYPAHYGLWHPPLYLYIVGIAFAFLGSSTMTARFVGAIMGILTLIIAAMLAKQVAQRRNIPVKATILLAVALCVINPYFIQGILHLDIDNTVLMPLVLLFLYCILRFDLSEPLSAARLLVPTLVLALTLWAKLTTPLLIMAALGGSYLLRKRWNAVANLFVIGAIGSAIFLVTWAIYVTIFKLPIDFFLRFTFLQKTSYLTEGGTWFSRVNSAAHLYLWMTPPFAALVTLAGIKALIRARSKPGIKTLIPACTNSQSFEDTWILSIALIAVFIAYTLWVPTIAGKYRVILIPFGALLSAFLIMERFKAKDDIPLLPAMFWGGFCLAFYGLLVSDLMYVSPTVSRIWPGGQLKRILTDPRLLTWSLSSLPLLIGLIFFSIRSSLRHWIDRFLIVALVAAITVGIVQNIRSATTEYSPLSFQIQPGFNDVVTLLRAQCRDGIVFAPKDIGYHLYPNCRVIPIDETEIFEFRNEADMFSVLQSRKDIKWAVDSQSYPNLRLFPTVEAYLASEFNRFAVVGDFVIYRRNLTPK